MINTFPKALEAFCTTMSFHFDRWLNHNCNVFAAYKKSLGLIFVSVRLLEQLQNLVAQRISDGHLDKSEVEEVVLVLESEYPFYQGVAGNTRRETLAFTASRVAEQMGATLEETESLI
ncbi:MAG: hypothetical protein QNJ70_04415 [Xenococcaceae cyanobacterium MO_207.B15]|nr:hypothetical protein [Xenococcaceae cyanobacterium MO_207.B15]MDJ0747805.1 hypothetical protein [Xenococcaceae cyanobacterium MO_167.B27]